MNSEPIYFRHQSRVLRIAMIPLLLAGLACAIFGSVLMVDKSFGAKPGAGIALTVMGVGTALLSAGLMTARWELAIDRSLGHVSRVRGAFGLYAKQTYSLASFHGVSVQYAAVTSGTQMYYRYRVSLLANQDSLYLTEYGEPKPAIEKANEIGSYLGMPVEVDEQTTKDLG